MSQFSLFNLPNKTPNDAFDEWIGMPEYNNSPECEPEIIAIFKFKTTEDFKKFNHLLRDYVFDGEKPFDGMQSKDRKSTWFPHKEKGSKYLYIDES